MAAWPEVTNGRKDDMQNSKALRCIIVIVTALFINSAHADTFTYVCTDHGRSYPLKVDDKQNTLTWKGSVYKIKQQEDCAKYGWHAEKDGASFNFCTATKGGGGIEQNDGTVIQCNIPVQLAQVH
jgi:hypothetical protein